MSIRKGPRAMCLVSVGTVESPRGKGDSHGDGDGDGDGCNAMQ